MALPAAPTESGGAKLHFLVYDNAGSNAAAIVRGIAEETINSDVLAHMAVATHAEDETYAAGDPVMLAAGIDGTDIVPMAVTSTGDLQVSLDGEAVVLGAGTAEIGKLAAGVAEIGNVKNSGTFAVQVDGSALTALQKIDNVPHARNAVFSEAGAIGGEMDDTATVAATEGNVSPVRITAQRALHANLRNNAGTETGTSGEPIRVDPTGSTTQPVSGTVTSNAGTNLNTSSLVLDATLAAVIKDEDAGHTTADKGIMALAVRNDTPGTLAGTDLDYAPLQLDADGNLRVNLDTALPSGTNAIGKLAANSGVDIGDVDILTQPARVHTTDKITAYAATDKLMNGTTELTPKFVSIAANTSGNNALVAAVSAKTIRVLNIFISAEAPVDIYFNDGTADLVGDSTHLIKLDNTGAVGVGGFATGEAILGHFQTAAVNRPINVNLSGAIDIAGWLVYVEV